MSYNVIMAYMRICFIIILMILTGCAALNMRTTPTISGDCPYEYDVKGNDSRAGWIYHTMDSPFYYRVKAEECFKTETAAKRAGYRKFRTYNNYRR
jgi:hypothetical protein